jgi:hypothetical protein
MRSARIGVAYLLAGAAALLCLGCSEYETWSPEGETAPETSASEAGSSSRTLAPEAQRLIGLWKGKMTDEFTVEGPNVEVIEAPDGPEELEVSAEFKDDGTLNMDMFFELSGTWELVKAEGDKLTINSVMEMEMPSFEGEATEAMEEIEVESEKEEMEFTIVFETDDRITMAPTDEPDQAATLERQR